MSPALWTRDVISLTVVLCQNPWDVSCARHVRPVIRPVSLYEEKPRT